MRTFLKVAVKVLLAIGLWLMMDAPELNLTQLLGTVVALCAIDWTVFLILADKRG